MTYAEKLKKPAWQKKRLQVLQRDNWTCQLCGDVETSLHVHHNQYNGNPAATKNEFLITYCADCHYLVEYLKKYHKELKPIKVSKRLFKEENAIRLLCIVYNFKKAEKGIVLLKTSEGKFIDGLLFDKESLDEIKNFYYNG